MYLLEIHSIWGIFIVVHEFYNRYRCASETSFTKSIFEIISYLIRFESVFQFERLQKFKQFIKHSDGERFKLKVTENRHFAYIKLKPQ